MEDKFDIELIPDVLRSRRRALDDRMFKQMRLPRSLQEARLRDLRSPVIEYARSMVKMLDTVSGPMARIYIVYGGLQGQHTQFSAGFMKLAQMFGFMTIWADASEIRSFDSPMVDEERTIFEATLDADLLVVDCSSVQDVVGKRANTSDIRRVLRRRILENRSTILNLTCNLDELVAEERRSFVDLLMHSASRTLFFNTDEGALTAGVSWI